MSPTPLNDALIKLYTVHQRFFYLNNFQNFKLFASWYLSVPAEVGYEICPATGGLPWYRRNWELSELAKILKCSEQDVLGTLEEIYNDY